MKLDPVIFREYDIRGVVGEQFDTEFAVHLGRALATYIHRKTKKFPVISVGYDARLSSPELMAAITEGILDCGGRVIQLGLITTPISYFSTFVLPELNGAIMITGSHNPPDYNGFKISVGKTTIFGDEIQQLRKIIESKEYSRGASGGQSTYDIFPQYLERYRKEFGQIKNIPLVLDCGNGAGGCIARKLYEGVGLKPTILYETPDGRFPNHHPDPTVEKNLVELAKTVREKKAVAGIGFDGDADRIGVVDENGRMVLGDELMVLISQSVIQKNPGAKIIGDVKCSDRLYDFIRSIKGVPIMWKTGHSLIKEKVRLEGAPFGGELSGHIFFADRNYGYDDALYAGLRLVEILAETGLSISTLLKVIPTSFCTPEIRIDTTEEIKYQVVDRLRTAFSKPSGDYKVNDIDGIRISFKDGWALARVSNTQPVVVLRFESTTESGLARIREQVESQVKDLI